MLTSETKRRIDACRDVLVGKLPLPTDQVELITLALIYKFMDDLDEESLTLGGKRSFFVNGLSKYRWRNLLPQTVSAEHRVTLFSEGVEALGNPKKAGHLPGLFRDIFRNAFLKFRDGRILTMFLTEVNGFAYSHSEELGNAFEYLLQCMGIQGENGQFRTPRHIIDFMVACLDPQPGDRILDPACGTGGFLVSAYKHILAKNTSTGSTMPGDRLTHGHRQKLYANLAGYDVTDLMVKLSKVNLFLHGFPDPAIHIYDTLSNDARWNEKADLILANPPFMTPKGGVTPHTKFRVAAKKAEVLFTDYIAEHLTADGRGGVIVPNGIVATTQNAYVKLRRFLVEDSLVAVISLPSGVFKPYSGVKTSILFLDKALARQSKEILFLKITADGFDLGDQRRAIAENDLPEAERVVKAWFRAKLSTQFQTPIQWTAATRTNLLDRNSCSLQGESFFGGETRTSEHQIVKLGDICEVVRGSSPRPQGDPKFFGGPVPRLMISDITRDGMWVTPRIDSLTEEGAKRSRPMKAGDVVMAVSASPGLPALLRVDACIHDGFAGLKGLPDDLNRTFLYYVLLALRAKHDRQADGATFRNITTDQIREFEIPLPPLEEQRRIVAEIEGYQKVLDGARQILAGYKPALEPTPDWTVTKLGEACEKIMDGTHFSPKNNAEGKYRYITAKNIKEMRLSLDDVTFIPEEAHREIYRRCPVMKGDVLYIKDGATTGIAALNPLDEEFSLLSSVAVLRGKKGVLDDRFLAYYLNSPQGKTYMLGMVSGVAITRLTLTKLNNADIPLPPLDEQRRIVEELDAEAAQMDSVRSLLPRFEGKIQRVLDRVWGNGPEPVA
jgi:type I restriction enzyme M protein